MARNEEKLFGRLNRLHLQKQREAELIKNPTRPHLQTLTTAAEIRRWIPTITRDLDLAVSRVIDDVNDKISKLRREHRLFTVKLRELDPSSAEEESSHTRSSYRVQKRPRDKASDDEPIEKKLSLFPSSTTDPTQIADDFLNNRIKLPILEKEAEEIREECEATNYCIIPNIDLQNKPLNIDHSKIELSNMQDSRRLLQKQKSCRNVGKPSDKDDLIVIQDNRTLTHVPTDSCLRTKSYENRNEISFRTNDNNHSMTSVTTVQASEDKDNRDQGNACGLSLLMSNYSNSDVEDEDIG